jgi:hypothetical protein
MAVVETGSNNQDIGLVYTPLSNTYRRDGNSLPNALDMIGELSVTSQFKVSLHLPVGGTMELEKWLSEDGLLPDAKTVTTYDFLCNEASLPGASIGVFEEVGSRQGMIEPFAANRIYPTFDMSFYVDSQYRMIRLFEEWMNFINPIHTSTGSPRPNSTGSGYSAAKGRPDYFRLRYPNEYRRIISITKFERDFHENPSKPTANYRKQTMLTYRMIDAFPTAITPIPVTYEGSVITKTRVTFSYSRYVIERTQNPERNIADFFKGIANTIA